MSHIRLTLLAVFIIMHLNASALILKLFIKKPPYQTSPHYTLSLHPTTYATHLLEEVSAPCVTYNPMNRLISDLHVVSLPQDQKVLWIKEPDLSFNLVQQLIEHHNTIHILPSKILKHIKAEYLRIEPNILIVPITLEKGICNLIKNHPSKKTLLAIFYPTRAPSPNLIIPLSEAIFKKKMSSASHQASWIYALAYSHSLSFPAESFVLKKLTMTKKGRIIAKKEHGSILKRISSLEFQESEQIIALGSSPEDLHLAMGGVLSQAESRKVPITQLYTNSINYKKALSKLLNTPYKTHYVFIPEQKKRSLLNELKKYVRDSSSLFVISYTTPWKDQWNLYHYHKDHGSHLNAWIGLIKLKQKIDAISLQHCGSDTAECYLVKKYPTQ